MSQWKSIKRNCIDFFPPNMLNTRLASGQYAACGFQIYLQRKHQPMIYQVLSCQHHPAHHYHQWQHHHHQHDQDHHQIYIPCCLFVMVSWISFIIDPKVQPISIDPMTNSLIINFFDNVTSLDRLYPVGCLSWLFCSWSSSMYSTTSAPRWLHFDYIPPICHRHHRRCLCKKFLWGVNFSRFSEKMQIYLTF